MTDIPMSLAMRAYNLHAAQRDVEALRCLDHALRLEPTLTGALFLKGIIALSHCDYKHGLPLFELRHQRINAGRYGCRYQDRPAWDGKPTTRRVLFWAEEGLGDTVMMLRFVPEARRRCSNLQLEVQPPLVRLAQQMGADTFGIFDREPAFDMQCSIMSLPLLLNSEGFGTTPYLVPNPRLAADWLGRMSNIKLGLCVRGNPNNGRDNVRSIPFSMLKPLSDEFDFISLSREDANFDDVADMAAMISNLDLVVTVDTLAAHVAGAMGKSVFLMLGVDCDWRWMQKRSDSPWYPSMKLFRQPRPGAWTELIEEVAIAIREFQGGASRSENHRGSGTHSILLHAAVRPGGSCATLN